MKHSTYKDLVLDDFQKEAFECIDQGRSLIVSAPTGAGKTLIADYAIEEVLRSGQEIVYTAPIKALSNQKYRDFQKQYGDKVGILTGDVSINASAPVLIMTTEIFRNMELVEPARLERTAWVIFDEIHYLDDMDRGTVWEESIMLKPSNLRILALSATVPNLDRMAGWMESIHGSEVRIIEETKRPVPLHVQYQCDDRIYSRFGDLVRSGSLAANDDLLHKLRKKENLRHKPNRLFSLFRHIQDNGLMPVIYFSFSRKRCEELSRELESFNFLSAEERTEIRETYDGLLKTFDLQEDRTAVEMGRLVDKGIAYHHAGLLPTLKEVIERLFTSRLLKAIFTTETFALGINMPARSVVFDTVRKFYGRYHANLKTRDFFQMAGRAGRRGIDSEGTVFLRVNPLQVTIRELNRIVYGRPEKIISQFSSIYATLMNLYREMGDRIFDIYPRSFHFFQSGKINRRQARDLLKGKIAVLREMGYIDDQGGLSDKGELASRMYSYELAIGELYESGYLENLAGPELAVVCTALVYEARKGVPAPVVPKSVKRIKKRLDNITRKIRSVERRKGVYPPVKNFCFYLTEFVHGWYDGLSFEVLTKDGVYDAGGLVRTMRMTVQVLRELLFFEGFSEQYKKNVKDVLNRINRDEVDAEHQLRQEI